jgi:hypothetical protein
VFEPWQVHVSSERLDHAAVLAMIFSLPVRRGS